MTTNEFFKTVLKRHNILNIQAADMCGRGKAVTSYYISNQRKMPMEVLETFMRNLDGYASKQFSAYEQDYIEFRELKTNKGDKS
jgi:hypothetical protein